MMGLVTPASALEALALSRATLDVTIRKVIGIHLVRSAHHMVRSNNQHVSRHLLWRMFLTRFRKLARDYPKERAVLVALALAGAPPVLPAS